MMMTKTTNKILEIEKAKAHPTIDKAKGYNTQTMPVVEIEDGSNTTTIPVTIIMANQEAMTTTLHRDEEEDKLPRVAIIRLTRNTIATDHRHICITRAHIIRSTPMIDIHHRMTDITINIRMMTMIWDVTAIE